MFKRWYVYETDSFFVNHMAAFHQFSGPYTKSKAREIALWRLNQAMRNGTKINIDAVHCAVKQDVELRQRLNEIQ